MSKWIIIRIRSKSNTRISQKIRPVEIWFNFFLVIWSFFSVSRSNCFILFDFLKTTRILQLATFPSPFLFVFNQFSNTHFCFIVSLNITIIILILKNNIPLPFCCCRCWISQSQSYYKSNAHSHTIMWYWPRFLNPSLFFVILVAYVMLSQDLWKYLHS